MTQIRSDLFSKDLKYLVEPKAKLSESPPASHSHWLATAVITVLVGVWIGSDPSASINVENAIPLGTQFETTPTTHSGNSLLKLDQENLVDSALIMGPPKSPLTNANTVNKSTKSLMESPQTIALSGIDFGPHTMITGQNQHPVSRADDFSEVVTHMDRLTDFTAFIDEEPEPSITPVSFTVNTEIKLNDFSGNTDRWVIVDIKRGDTLSKIFKNHRIDPEITHNISRSKQGSLLNNLQTGPNLRLRFNIDHQLVSLRYNVDALRVLVCEFADDHSFTTNLETRKVNTVQRTVSGVINSSLFGSAAKAGISDQLVLQIASIFKWNIDFSKDLQKGDTFSVIFEEKYIAGTKFSNGGIVAAAFNIGGKRYTAFRDTDTDGNISYYSLDGHSLKRAFLRSPVEFSRISSQFSKKRFHPVLKKWRAHKGVDYAASRGTPITATADGVIRFKGRKGGYGRVIIIQHGKEYQTLYGHLNSYNKKIKNGGRVKQGQVIGYVGSSGLATGPHLHYEFRVNGVHKNPLTVKVPRALPIAGKKREQFLKTARLLDTKLLNSAS